MKSRSVASEGSTTSFSLMTLPSMDALIVSNSTKIINNKSSPSNGSSKKTKAASTKKR